MKDHVATILSQAVTLAQRLPATGLLAYWEQLSEAEGVAQAAEKVRLILVLRGEQGEAQAEKLAAHVLKVPRARLTRQAQIALGVLTAASQGLSQPGEVLVCLAGPCGRPEVDVIQVVRLAETAPALCSGCADSSAGGVGPQVFTGLLKLAVELAQEGREGRPIGTTFVLGDHEKVLQFSRQAVLNPFAGYPEEALSVLSQEMKETIREFSSLDGAFVVRGDGVLLAAGRHIQASAADVELPQGMGARHHAAAGISAVTAAMAMVISESSGTVTVFNKGQIVASLEKARPNLMAEARF